MTRTANLAIETKVQVIDVNGDPVTAATVSYTIYGEDDVSHFTGSMTHIGSGIYSCSWTPDAVGEWTAECYSSNPKFRKSFTYHVILSGKYAWKDHDSAFVNLTPPITNQWYTIFDESDVRLLEMNIYQKNDETDRKAVEVRWTIDGNVYFCSVNADDDTEMWILKEIYDSYGGTSGLTSSAVRKQACDGIDKRGQSFKVEVRQVAENGTNQQLYVAALYETLEEC